MYGSFFAFIGNCVAFPIKAKSAPRGSHCGEKEFVASRPAAGGESCGAGFYFYAWRSADKTENLLVMKQGSTGGFSLEFLSLFD